MVLSIDFDYIMAPCIQEYNNNINSNNIFAERKYTFSNLKCDFEYDKEKLDWLKSLIKQLGPNRTKAYVINDHSEVATALTNEYNLNDYNPPYQVINIDHHHDLGYRFAFDECNCANWAQYLINIGVMDKYIWVRNNNSDIVIPEEHSLCPGMIQTLSQEEFVLDPNKIDIFVLCLSYPWIPPEFDHLILGMIGFVCNHWGGGQNVTFLEENYEASIHTRKYFQYMKKLENIKVSY